MSSTGNTATTGLPPQVDLVRGDLTLPETLDGCLDGANAVFLVWTAPPSAVAPALERILERAQRIVFLSAPIKTTHPLFQQPNPLRVMVEEIERWIAASGRQWTFFASTAPIDERDIAAVAVRALCDDDGHAGAEYVLTGPQSLSQSEQISIIGRAVGRSLQIVEISPDEARHELLTIGWPLPAVNMLLAAWAAAIGQPALVTSTVFEITGTPPHSFLDWATDNAAGFRA